MLSVFGPALPKPKISWRNLFSLALLVVSLSGLAACDTSNAGGKIQLTMWYWNRSIDDTLINAVDRQFPNIHLVATKITDYDTKIRTSMAGHTAIPDIIGINSNIATYFPDENMFVDLRTLGANDLKSEYLPWKWQLGVASDGKMIGFPMDTGPTALFYRSDIFAKAGLPTDPAQVTAQIHTWDQYLQAGVKLKNATQGKAFIVDDVSDAYQQILAQSPKQYLTTSNQYMGNQPYLQKIWNEATQVAQLGIDDKVQRYGTSWNEAASNGSLAAFMGAVWMKQILQDAAPDTAGKWRIARAPGGDGNSGGSFLGITTASQHPKEAFEVIKWLQSPQNQLTAYKDLQLFPSAVSAINDPAMYQNEAFYGGEDTTNIFAVSAKNIPITYISPFDVDINNIFVNELNLIDFQGAASSPAWNLAQQEAQNDLLR
jgi:cellobiose transport system substrate-binding protein